jgi:hypothetical protein
LSVSGSWVYSARMVEAGKQAREAEPTHHHLARVILFAFLLAFVAARVSVLLIMSSRLPDLYLYVGGTHVHHLNYGIFLLAGVGACLLLGRPAGRRLTGVAVLYGVGLALTFDEFGMWLHLGGSYWQRASWDAMGVLAAALGLLAYSPSLKQCRPCHWWGGAVALVAAGVFFALLAESFAYAGRLLEPKLIQMERRVSP